MAHLSPNGRFPVRRSPPCRVLFAGWESDTFTLGRQGWEIAIDESSDNYGYNRRVRMLLRHPVMGMEGIAESLESFHATQAHLAHLNGDVNDHLPIFQVRRMGSKVIVERMASPMGMQPFDGFQRIDTAPSVAMLEHYELGKLPLFAPLNAPAAEQIILPEQDISELLAQIRARQAPMQADIRERERRRDSAVPTVHASILTLPMAA